MPPMDFMARLAAVYNRLIERIEHVAIGSRAPVLLIGPMGAGKS